MFIDTTRHPLLITSSQQELFLVASLITGYAAKIGPISQDILLWYGMFVDQKAVRGQVLRQHVIVMQLIMTVLVEWTGGLNFTE